jgi:hypothetical protein
VLAKMTGKNQLTLRKAILEGLDPEYYKAERAGGEIILTSVSTRAAEELQEKAM